MMKCFSNISFQLAARLSRSTRQNRVSGFTLIELMVTVVIVAILAAIAFPSYTAYMERRDLAIVKQEALRISTELERFKSKNFSYKGFDASYLFSYVGVDENGAPVPSSYYNKATGQLFLPLGSTTSTAKYTLTLVDGGTEYKPLTIAKNNDGTETSDSASVNGLTWVIALERAKDSAGEPKQPRNYDLLLTSTGSRCMTKTKNTVINYVNCGSDGESW